MILVVADTGPIHYLVLIEAVEILPRLYERVVLPEAVLAELTHPHAPPPVKAWATQLPSWAEVRTAAHVDLGAFLDPGEAEAIALAEELKADSILMDEMEARQEALRRGLPVAGTIGVLEKASQDGLVDLPGAFQRLAQTNFFVSPHLIKQALERDALRRSRRSRERGEQP